MRKLASLAIIGLSIIALMLMLWSILSGPPREETCVIDDYDCNYRQYAEDIMRKPPNFARAETLAIQSPEVIQLNIRKVLTLPDYEAASMVRVLQAYPNNIQKNICQSNGVMSKLQDRARRMVSNSQRQEFVRLLSELNCE